MKFAFISIFIVFLFFTGCKEETTKSRISGTKKSEIEQAIENVNRYILKRNHDQIRGFLRRTEWEMEKTGSGLFFMVTGKGNGPHPEEGNIVTISYEVFLIDGETITEKKEVEFRLGHGGVIRGIEEAALLMKEGTEARIIVPPHLGYGNFGDAGNGVPPDAILIYNLKLLTIK